MQQQTLDNIGKGMERMKDYIVPAFYILPFGMWAFIPIQLMFGILAASIGFLIVMFSLYHFAFYYRESKRKYSSYQVRIVDWWLAKGWPISEKEIIEHIRELDSNPVPLLNIDRELTGKEVEMINNFCYNNMTGLFKQISEKYSPYQKYWVFKQKSDFVAFKMKFLTK